MTKNLFIVVVAVLLLILTGCGSEEKKHECSYDEFVEYVKPTTTTRGHSIYKCECGEVINIYDGLASEEQFERKLGFMFVGNSMTDYQSLPKTFKKIANSQGFEVNIYWVTCGGFYLSQFADLDGHYGAALYTELKENHYDFMFIQDQSLNPVLDYDSFVSSANEIDSWAKEENTQTILYETIARKKGQADLEKHSITSKEMTQKLEEAYLKCGEYLGIPVSLAGTAVQYIYENYGEEIEMYQKDKLHPSPYATYLIALVHYANVYGLSPIGVSYKGAIDDDLGVVIDDETALILQEAAYKVVFEGHREN